MSDMLDSPKRPVLKMFKTHMRVNHRELKMFKTRIHAVKTCIHAVFVFNEFL